MGYVASEACLERGLGGILSGEQMAAPCLYLLDSGPSERSITGQGEPGGQGLWV